RLRAAARRLPVRRRSDPFHPGARPSALPDRRRTPGGPPRDARSRREHPAPEGEGRRRPRRCHHAAVLRQCLLLQLRRARAPRGYPRSARGRHHADHERTPDPAHHAAVGQCRAAGARRSARARRRRSGGRTRARRRIRDAAVRRAPARRGSWDSFLYAQSVPRDARDLPEPAARRAGLASERSVGLPRMTSSVTARSMSQSEVEAHVAAILRAIDPEPEREGLERTPMRVARALAYLTKGSEQDPASVINGALFTEPYSEMIVVRDIDFFSLCEHHILPFFGQAHVAYIPRERIVGISKVARLVDVYARRLQVQE